MTIRDTACEARGSEVTVPDPRLPDAWAASRVTVVVPTYNEAGNILEALRRLVDLPLPNLRVVVVDDGSPDGTADLAEQFGKEMAGTRPDLVRVVRRTSKDGLGKAYAVGMRAALDDGAEYVVQMDADLSHKPEYIPQMLGALRSTCAGVAIGSRYVAGGSLAEEWGFLRRLLSGWANFYVNTILGLRIRDVTAGFKLWRRDALESLQLESLRSAGYSFQVEMNYRARTGGWKVIEVPIHFEERNAGASKMSLKVQLESARLPLALRFGKSPRI